MAQGGIRKGFFFYFGLFVLLLITIFCICLVIMIFNPGKSVLWMQYFSSNEHVMIDSVSGKELNWSEVKELNINCKSYANVTLERNNDPDMAKDAVYVINDSKGFTAASDAVKFDCEVSYQNGILTIDVTEPSGFLFFRKDVEVVIHACIDRNVNFSNINLNVETKEGNVDIGGLAGNNAQNVKLKGLTVKTESGNISITNQFDASGLEKISLTTNSGEITSGKEIEVETSSGTTKTKGLKLDCDATFVVEGRGLISLDTLIAQNHKITLTNKKGNVVLDYVDLGSGQNSELVCANCVEGNFLFGKIYGNLTFNSSDTLISPNITVDYISGNFYLAVNKDKGGEPDIKIKNVGGNVTMFADKGNLHVEEISGTANVESKDNLKVDITLAENCGAVYVANNSGHVNLTFLGNIPKKLSNSESKQVAGVTVTTNTGKATINIISSAKFKAQMYKNNEEHTLIAVDDSKLHINIGDEMIENHNKNPLVVNGAGDSDGDMTITSNGDIEFNVA